MEVEFVDRYSATGTLPPNEWTGCQDERAGLMTQRGETRRGTETDLLAPLCGRITPRQVLEAYKETGLIPRTGRFYDDGRACALGAIAAVGMSPTDDWGKVFSRIRLDRDYMDSFINGFDNNFTRRLCFPSRAGRKGYRDGERARRFVFGKQDTGEPGTGGGG